MEPQQQLLDAAERGDVEEVSSLLTNNPGLDVNCPNERQITALHYASGYGCVEVVKLLLAHPHINVNVRVEEGQTPLSLGCWNGKVSVVEVLLKDPRVDVTLDDIDGRTPLWGASFNGYDEVIEWLIASGRDLGNVTNVKGKYGVREFSALEIARAEKFDKVSALLERFVVNPTQTRHELRVKLGVLDEVAAEIFALTVFLCDDLLHLKPALASSTSTFATARFFAIAFKLPMELQMILCRRAVGSMKQNTLRKDSEAAFKSLAKILSSK